MMSWRIKKMVYNLVLSDNAWNHLKKWDRLVGIMLARDWEMLAMA
ncbi:hypothetical protein SSU05_0616 [Streptococcus suis 05ZYH33]|nr:hypothetical protein SSU05_0616 [Streptococcus suis 05ZYH33]